MTDVLTAARDAGEGPHLHFSRAEFEARLSRLRARMAEAELDGLLLFAQESLYWLTGFDTFGYCFFQTLLVLPEGDAANGGLVLLTRSADLRQAQVTSILEDIRVWTDGLDADPTEALQTLLDEKGLTRGRIGVETNTHGLTAANWRQLDARAGATARLIDASSLVSELRLVKSPAEIAYVRRAAELGDACYRAARRLIRPGADEAEILAAFQGENFALGGDYPGNEFILGSGPAGSPYSGALLCRYFSGRRRLSEEDQITLEWAGVWRRYHAALMRTVPVGRALPEHERMHAAARDALLACEAALKPGAPMADAFDAHASYAFVKDDLHHQIQSRPGNPQGGLLCQDCHTSIDMHGDGNIFGTTLAQVEIECEDCHGTVTDAYPMGIAAGVMAKSIRRRSRRMRPRGTWDEDLTAEHVLRH